MRTKKQIKEYQRLYQIKNKKRLSIQHKIYRIIHKDEIFLKKQEYRRKNHKSIALKKKKYRIKNRELLLIKSKKYRIKNRDRLNQKRKTFRLLNLEKYRECGRRFYENHKEKIKKDNYRYKVKRLKKDLNYKLAQTLRNRLRLAVKSNQKTGSAVRDLECTIPELKIHLEKQFTEGMSWDNWSLKGWHIDHKIPLSSFDLTKREELLKAVNYTNLQPLWANKNYSKGSKLLD